MASKIVGMLHVAEGAKWTRRYEVAAWYTVLALEPGDHPIEERPATRHQREWGFGPRVVVRVPAVIKAEYMPAMFGGVAVAHGPSRVGQPEVQDLTGSLAEFLKYTERHGTFWGLPVTLTSEEY